MSQSIQPEPSPPARRESNKHDNQSVDICAKCYNRSSCKHPCYFVNKILNFENPIPFEIELEGKIILFPKRGQKRESELYTYDDSGEKEPEGERAFSTENESAFLNGVSIETKQTGIFIDVFFKRFTYADCAKKYETSVENVRTIYSQSKKRIVEILNADVRKKLSGQTVENTARMSKDMRIFLMYTVFGLTASEVADLLGDNDPNNRYIRKAIAKIRDKVLTGNVDLSDFIEGSKGDAAIRLEKIRAARKVEAEKRRKKLSK